MQFVYVTNVINYLMNARWWRNDATEMHVYRTSMGLKTLKIEKNNVNAITIGSWFTRVPWVMDALGSLISTRERTQFGRFRAVKLKPHLLLNPGFTLTDFWTKRLSKEPFITVSYPGNWHGLMRLKQFPTNCQRANLCAYVSFIGFTYLKSWDGLTQALSAQIHHRVGTERVADW